MENDALNDRSDRIGWRQIAVGYAVCVCTAGALLAVLWTDTAPNIETILAAVVVGVTVLTTATGRPLGKLFSRMAEQHPATDSTLKYIAVGALCVLSFGITVMCFVIWQGMS